MDEEIKDFENKVGQGKYAEIVKPKPFVIEPLSQAPLLSLDFADDLFTDNETNNKEKTFDFFDDDY